MHTQEPIVHKSIFLITIQLNMIYKFDKNIIKLCFLLILPIMVLLIVNYIVKNIPFSICLWKNLFHSDCLGCGFTRAFYSMLHLDIKSAIEYNISVVIIVPILMFTWLHEIYKIIKQKP